ncbi:MAG: hypothetical protein LBO81_03595 [Clostridiales Family XIII bacterium]|nr:hypothetical protein [Clostridiales Family XIII bacterium]
MFEYAEDGASYDVLLCFGGCANDCAATDGYDFGKLVSVRGPAGTQRAVDELTGFAADMAKSDHATGGQEP